MAGPVIGSEELRRALVAAGSSFNHDIRQRLRYFAQPVAHDAERLAVGRIRRIGPQWARMRTGATGQTAYVAPVMRGTRVVPRKRPKFARLLLTRSMEPALEINRDQVEKSIDGLLARMERRFENG